MPSNALTPPPQPPPPSKRPVDLNKYVDRYNGSLSTDVPPPSGKIGRGDVCESPLLIVFRYTFA